MDEDTKHMAQETFNIISGGAPYFDLAMFTAAKTKDPDLLDWLNEPEHLVKAAAKHSVNVPYGTLEKYHKSVLLYVHELEDQLCKQL
jgi:hypothetical protein